MEELMNKRKAKILSLIWMLSIIPVYIYAGIRQFGLESTKSPDPVFGIFLLLIIAVYFFPITVRIHKYARLGNMPKLTAISQLFIWLFKGVFVVLPFACLIMIIVK